MFKNFSFCFVSSRGEPVNDRVASAARLKFRIIKVLKPNIRDSAAINEPFGKIWNDISILEIDFSISRDAILIKNDLTKRRLLFRQQLNRSNDFVRRIGQLSYPLNPAARLGQSSGLNP